MLFIKEENKKLWKKLKIFLKIPRKTIKTDDKGFKKIIFKV